MSTDSSDDRDAVAGSPARPRPRRRAPRRRRPGGRSADVREAVLRASLDLLTREGFAALSLPAVAERAGVHKTTVYRWWSTPLELLHEALAEAGLEALALPDVDTGSWEGDLEAFVASRVELIRNPLAAGLLKAAIATGGGDPTLAGWVRAVWEPRRSEWSSPVERAIERGELRASARAVPLVELVAGPLLLAELVNGRAMSADEIRSIARTVAAGVRAEHGR